MNKGDLRAKIYLVLIGRNGAKDTKVLAAQARDAAEDFFEVIKEAQSQVQAKRQELDTGLVEL